LAVVGSPDYLRRRKRPERIDDLRQHACLRARTRRSHPGALSMATRRSRRSCPGHSSRTTTPRCSEQRSKARDLCRCPHRLPKRRLRTADCERS
jgi:hypothetical protein